MSFSHKKNSVELNPDQWALEEFCSGNVKALGYLYDRYIDYLLELGLYYVKDEVWIEDQIHDLFLDLFKGRKNLIKINDFKAYLTVSFKRRLYKKTKNKEIVLEEESFKKILKKSPSHLEKSAETSWIDQERVQGIRQALNAAIASLTLHQQNAIQLRYAENKSYDEIAEQMDMSVSSARTLLYRSIKLLKEKLHLLFF